MYDALNKGLRIARGDVLAYLNCDEQYLPGTLAFVTRYLSNIRQSTYCLGIRCSSAPTELCWPSRKPTSRSGR